MTVRKIGPEDAVLWRSIRLEALSSAPEAFSARLEDWQNRPVEDFAAQVLANPVFLALDGDHPVGSITWLRDSNHSDRAWIGSVFVSPSARGKGLGQALIQAAMIDASENGMRDIWLEVGARNIAARSTYERAGFVAVTGPDRPRRTCAVCEVSMWRKLG